jgi:anti-sigma factor RsiW
VNHPDAGTLMSLLYGELPAAKKRELEAHLNQCPVCAVQVHEWRESMGALDAWKISARHPSRRGVVPVLKWAVAAAIVLAMGIAVGRQTSRNSDEIASLKASVAELSAVVQQQKQAGTTNAIDAANAESQRLFADFTRAQNAQRAEDRQALSLTLRNFDNRIDRLRTEIETVALNTQNGFEETHQVLASFTPPSSQSSN